VATFGFGQCRGAGSSVPTSPPQLAPGLPHADLPAHVLADPCSFSNRLLSLAGGVVVGFIPGAGTIIPPRSMEALRRAGLSGPSHFDLGLPVASASRVSAVEVTPEDLFRSKAVVAALDIASQGGAQITAVAQDFNVGIPAKNEEFGMAGNVVPFSVRQAVAAGRQPNPAVSRSIFGGIVRGIGGFVAGLIPGGRTIVDIATGILGGGGGGGARRWCRFDRHQHRLQQLAAPAAL